MIKPIKRETAIYICIYIYTLNYLILHYFYNYVYMYALVWWGVVGVCGGGVPLHPDPPRCHDSDVDGGVCLRFPTGTVAQCGAHDPLGDGVLLERTFGKREHGHSDTGGSDALEFAPDRR